MYIGFCDSGLNGIFQCACHMSGLANTLLPATAVLMDSKSSITEISGIVSLLTPLRSTVNLSVSVLGFVTARAGLAQRAAWFRLTAPVSLISA